jgi:hypothetical protein
MGGGFSSSAYTGPSQPSYQLDSRDTYKSYTASSGYDYTADASACKPILTRLGIPRSRRACAAQTETLANAIVSVNHTATIVCRSTIQPYTHRYVCTLETLHTEIDTYTYVSKSLTACAVDVLLDDGR